MTAALFLTGCNTAEEEPEEPAADDQQLFHVGVTMSSPGLISGTDPDNVSGTEIDLAIALGEQLDVITAENEISWIAADPTEAAEQLDSGELDLLIGQFRGPELTEDISWVGPYATVEAGLLVRDHSTDADEESDEVIATRSVESFEDLEEATVCVVAGSIAHGTELPVDEVVTQQTVTECETGMRSGRYDAIAADDLQLGGVLADPSSTGNYDLLLWSELAEDADAEVADDLVAPRHYWIGTPVDRCERVSAALRTVVAEGLLEEIYRPWEENTDFVPQVVETTDLTTQYCK